MNSTDALGPVFLSVEDPPRMVWRSIPLCLVATTGCTTVLPPVAHLDARPGGDGLLAACGPWGTDRIEVAADGSLTATPMSAVPASSCLSLGYAEALFLDAGGGLWHLLHGRTTVVDERPFAELRRAGGPVTVRGRSPSDEILLSSDVGVDVLAPNELGWDTAPPTLVREVRQGKGAVSAVGAADHLLVAWTDGTVGTGDGGAAEGLGGPGFLAGFPWQEPDEVLAIGPSMATPLSWERDRVAELPFALPPVAGASRGDTIGWTDECSVVAQVAADEDGYHVRYTALRDGGALVVDGPRVEEPPPFDAVGSPIPIAFARGGDWIVVGGEVPEAFPVDEAALDEACDPGAFLTPALFGDVVAIASHNPRFQGSRRFASLTATLRPDHTPRGCTFTEDGDCDLMVCPTSDGSDRPSVGPLTAEGLTPIVTLPGPRHDYAPIEVEGRRLWVDGGSVRVSAPGDTAAGFEVELPVPEERGVFDTFAISAVGDTVRAKGDVWIQWHDVPADEHVMVWLDHRHPDFDAVLTCAFSAQRRAGKVSEALLAEAFLEHSPGLLTVGHGRPVRVGDLRVTALQALLGGPGGAAYRLELDWERRSP